MKNTIQIKIVVVPAGIAVHGPFNENNNAFYKSLGGRYDRLGRRWILPNNEDAWRKLAELFGEESPIVIVVIPPGLLTIAYEQLQFCGYVIATWNTRKGCVHTPEGVEVVGGTWDEAASAAVKVPCLSDPDAVLHVAVRRAMADKHGLVIIKELENQPNQNPLAPYADSDLQVELEGRGYRVEQLVF
jgi:hypothetical protein